MIITLFFISSILLVEVSGKKYKENPTDTGNTVIILTSGGGITAKLNHKDNGLVRFPRGETNKSDSPISIEVKGMTNSGKDGKDEAPSDSPQGKLMKGFSPSYGNGIAPFSSLEYLYGNRVISMPSFMTRAHMHRRKHGDKSDAPESQKNEDKNSYMGYYDHHHYHYFRNGHPVVMDLRGRLDTDDEVQHEPPVGDEFRGHGHFNDNHHNGGNNGHGHFRQNHHNEGGGNNGNGENGYYYHGHYGPNGVVHFQSGTSESHGHGHGGHGYSYGNGNGYVYYYGNDDRGSGHHSNDNPQENYNELNSNGPVHRPQEFGFHDQPNNFNSHGSFRPPEGSSESNQPFHGDDQGFPFPGFPNFGGHHHSPNFDTGHNERYPSDQPNGEPKFSGPNYRPSGHGNNIPHHSEQDFRHGNHNSGDPHHGYSNFGSYDNRAEFNPQDHPSHRYSNAYPEGEHRQGIGSPKHFHGPYRSDASTSNSFHGANQAYRTPMSSTDTEYILKTRLQNPYIGEVYQNTKGIHYGGVTVHSNDFVPSEKETDAFRYGEPGGRGDHLNQKQYYRPVHTSGDYGHRVYYGNNHMAYTGRSIGGSGYAKRYGYSAKELIPSHKTQ